MLIVSPMQIPELELHSVSPDWLSESAVTMSSSDAVPCSTASTASSSVMIFVRLAG